MSSGVKPQLHSHGTWVYNWFFVEIRVAVHIYLAGGPVDVVRIGSKSAGVKPSGTADKLGVHMGAGVICNLL